MRAEGLTLEAIQAASRRERLSQSADAARLTALTAEDVRELRVREHRRNRDADDRGHGDT